MFKILNRSVHDGASHVGDTPTAKTDSNLLTNCVFFSFSWSFLVREEDQKLTPVEHELNKTIHIKSIFVA